MKRIFLFVAIVATTAIALANNPIITPIALEEPITTVLAEEEYVNCSVIRQRARGYRDQVLAGGGGEALAQQIYCMTMVYSGCPCN